LFVLPETLIGPNGKTDMNLGPKIWERLSYILICWKPQKFEHDLPPGLREDKPDAGNGILSTFILRRAKWHKACSLRYSGWKIGFLFSNLSKEEQAQSRNFGGEELVMKGVGRATPSSEPMAKVNEEICFISPNPGLGDTRSTKRKLTRFTKKF